MHTLRMFYRVIPAALLLFAVSFKSFSGNPKSLVGYKPMFLKENLETLKRRKKKSDGGLNIKVLPAFYWGTLGIEAEYALNGKLSVGINLLGTLGRGDGSSANYKVKPESFSEAGYRAELAFKYYFKGEAPTGLYTHLNLAYNELFYHDGNTRPYTLHNRWKEIDGLRLPVDFKKPIPFSAGLSFGYQLIVIPERIIANVLIGVQGNLDADNNPFIAIYAAPSIGYKF